MSPKKLDALFRELEQVQTDIDYENNDILSPGTATSTESQMEKERNILGLGLAVVARIIRNMNGQLRLKSEEGKGSRFSIQMPFTIPDASPATFRDPKFPVTSTEGPRTPHLENDPYERTLVGRDRSRSRPVSAVIPSVIRRHSDDSMHSSNSVTSFRSGNSNKSEVDRLLESFSGSPLAQTPITEEKRSLSGPTRSSRLSASSTKDLSPPPSTVLASPIAKPGSEPVTDTKTPLKAVRIDEGDSQPELGDTCADNKVPPSLRPASPRGDSVQSSASKNPNERRKKRMVEDLDQREFHVLVAEDDLVNSRIIKKRLEKLGHRVTLTVNGEECAAVFAERGADFDAVLMDIQMPIMDGYDSTKTIRKSESEGNSDTLPDTHRLNGRIPIVAVSASLLEKERQTYIDCGFDGWILKPVDFKRLNTLMDGIVNPVTRSTCLYTPGEWERGGWFGGCPSS
ncbi:Light-sensor Protein kinase [Arthrobotrys megalospora]